MLLRKIINIENLTRGIECERELAYRAKDSVRITLFIIGRKRRIRKSCNPIHINYTVTQRVAFNSSDSILNICHDTKLITQIENCFGTNGPTVPILIQNFVYTFSPLRVNRIDYVKFGDSLVKKQRKDRSCVENNRNC